MFEKNAHVMVTYFDDGIDHGVGTIMKINEVDHTVEVAWTDRAKTIEDIDNIVIVDDCF